MCTKTILAWTVASGLAALAAMPLTASAQHGNNGHHGWHGGIRHFDSPERHHGRTGAWRHGWHSGRNGWWWVAGSAWYAHPQPVYPYPQQYRPATIIVEQPSPSVVYVPAPASVPVQATQPPVAQPPVQQFWYYCEAASGYYPYVAACPGGWKTVPATPPGEAP